MENNILRYYYFLFGDKFDLQARRAAVITWLGKRTCGVLCIA